ncbi:urease accessory protein UreD [Actinomadura sp. NPDC049753]|uniref:urease accessory protein UreD n=1 Tax=Actinomadura sp. NPDC049753 TaxID=3154739 RepID=UPI003422DB5D
MRVHLVAVFLAAAAATGHDPLGQTTPPTRTPAPALRQAARRLGRQLTRAVRAVWPSPELERLAAARPSGAHQPVVLGLAAGTAGLTPRNAAEAAAYDSVRAPVTAAMAPPAPFGLRAAARLRAEAADGVTDLPLLHGDGPFALRRLRPRGSQARVCLLNTMSAPHNGDRLRIGAVVGPDADLHVISAAATVALPGPAPDHAVLDVALRVEDSARLQWLPEPVISAAGGDLRQDIRVDLARTARLFLGEQQILGRAQEPAGRLASRIPVRHGGRTLLDQHTAYAPGAPGWTAPPCWPGNRAVGQLLVVDPAYRDHPPGVRILDDVPARAHGVITPLAGPGVLLTAVAPDAGDLRRCLDAALHHLGHRTG